MIDYNQIESLMMSGQTERAMEILSCEIERLKAGDDLEAIADAYFHRGKLYWKLGKRPEATSDYVKAADMNPSGPASTALEQARDVESFFNPDLYNP